MLDTLPEIQDKLDGIYKTKSGEEKLLIAFQMYETAKKMAVASFPKNLSKKELRKKLFMRFYGDDFKDDEIKKILSRL